MTTLSLQKGNTCNLAPNNHNQKKNEILEERIRISDSNISENIKYVTKKFSDLKKQAKDLAIHWENQEKEFHIFPVGAFHSGSKGFRSPPNKSEGEGNHIGSLQMSHNAIHFSCESYRHYSRINETIKNRPSTGKENLDDFLNVSYVPLPAPIDDGNGLTPTIGPIPLNDYEALQFISKVDGPSLHDYLEYVGRKYRELNKILEKTDSNSEEHDENSKKLDKLKKFETSSLLTVSQITGFIQAYPVDIGTTPPTLSRSKRNTKKEPNKV